MTDKFMKDFQEYNALMKRLGSKTKTLEQYKAYRQGKPIPGARLNRHKATNSSIQATSYRRESPIIPSGDTYDKFVATKKEQFYTGSNLVGIATMHKSNAVPVFKMEDAEDIAKMRRN